MYYRVMCEDDYEIITLTDRTDFEYFASLTGNPVLEKWKDIEVKFDAADVNKKKKYSDFPWYVGSVLILRESVLSKMKEFFEKNGELLPLHSIENQKLYAFNCKTIDALDEEESDIVRLKSSGKIVLVKKLVLKNGEKINSDIFRLNYKGSPVYVSDNFIQMYKDYNFVGLKFLKYTENKLK